MIATQFDEVPTTSKPGRHRPQRTTKRKTQPAIQNPKLALENAAPPAPNPATLSSRPTTPARMRLQLRSAHAATIQLQQPAGHVSDCDGLGEFFSFDPERLVANTDQSFKQGCVELVGPWKDLGRWRRHIYHGVADTIEAQARLRREHDARNAVARPHAEAARYLALGHRRRAHHVHLAGRKSRSKIRRHVRGHHPRAARKIQNEQERSATSPARKVHEHYPLPRLHGCAAEPAGPRGHCRIRKFELCRRAATLAARSLPPRRVGRRSSFSAT